ncbi:MAG TPA: ABC transporter permease [Vicinamibacterales bacterium]
MDILRKDVLYAIRSLVRQPGFTLVTVLTLALGIGANTAVFSVVNGVLLRPLGYPQPEELEYITSQFPSLGFTQFWVSLPEFVEFRDHNRSFSSVGAYTVGAANLGTAQPSRPVLAIVTSELMPTLAVPPIRGRWFTAADCAPNAPPVAILSWELWQRSYGGRDDIVGQAVQINNQSNEIVGIMPRGYDVHDQKVELWQPLTIDPSTFATRRGNHFLYLVGRRKDGVTRAQALADLDRMLTEWPKTIAPGTHAPNNANPQSHRLRMDPLRDDIVGGVRQALVVLQSAVAFVLLIACANLANLLVARADSRMREYAVRTALGATRLRLFRQLLTEGMLLTFIAAAVGVGLAYAGVEALLAVNPDAIPRTVEIGLDRAVLGFTLGVAVATGLIFALVPLLHLSTVRSAQAFRESSTRTTAAKARLLFRSALVVGEVALAVTLVVGAGLLIRSFMNLTRVDMGFNHSQLSTFGVVLPQAKYNAQQRIDFYANLATRLRALPGVHNVSAMSGLPPLRNVNANDTDFEHIPNNRQPGEGPIENVDFYQYVTIGYAETMGIPVIKGRSFEQGDVGGAAAVMVNEALAKKFFTDRDPIGGHIRPGGPNLPWFTVVGVLKDVKQGGVAEAAGTELYMLSEQLPRVGNFAPGTMNFVVRSSVPLSSLANEYRRAVGELDPTLPLIRMREMNTVIGDAIARPRFLTVLLGIFAGLALVLAAVGTYGILAYLVAERKQEIGIRMALGADRAKVLSLVLGRGLLLSGIGLVLGLGASLALTRVIATLLFNVTPTDPLTLASVAGVIALVAAAACIIPAWRATRVDPLVVLKAD